MDKKMYSVSCDPICGFMVKSHDEDEVVSLAMEHVSSKHPEKHITMDQLKSTVKAE
jgi:predicted small metal-binding protein